MKTKPGFKNKPAASPMANLQTAPFIPESSLRQLQQLYGKPQPMNNSESIGTLPASSMDAAVAAAANKLSSSNRIVPIVPVTKKEQAKITADLMDVDFD